MKNAITMLGAGLIALTACAPAGVSALDVHEIMLYGLNERHVIFYGSSEGQGAQFKLGNQDLDVSRAPASGPLAVPDAYSVNGKPTLLYQTSPIREAFALATIPLSGDLSLTTRSGLEAVYFFDGRSWFDASGPVNGDQKVRVTPRPRAGLRGVGALTTPEADALAGYLANRGPVAVALLTLQTAPDRPLSFEPAPRTYLRTALYVQVGVPTDVLGGLSAPAPLDFEVISSGGNAAYTSQTPGVRLDATAASLAQTWGIVGGNQLPAPTPPSVDFGRSRVVTVFQGQKATGGFGIALAGARLEGNTLTLEVNLREPAPGAILTQALTSPYIAVRVNNTAFSSVRVVNKANGQVIARAP